MCDPVPSLDPAAAADRLADAYDVPELTEGVLGREPERQRAAGRFLSTYPLPGAFTIELDRPWGGPPPDRWIYEHYPWGVIPKRPYHPWVYGLPEI